MIPTYYQGSVKNVLGPVKSGNSDAFVFQYSDSFSVFDWGKLPDELSQKGEALAIISSYLFERLESPKAWKEFSGTPQAQSIRKGISTLSAKIGGMKINPNQPPVTIAYLFNELGEKLQYEGLRTHYLGAQESWDQTPKPLSELKKPFRYYAVKKVSVCPPTEEKVLGRSVLDYSDSRESSLPKLIPLEVVFRYSCPQGSSLLKRVQKNADYLSSLPLPVVENPEDLEKQFDAPLIEFFTKLESTDRPVMLTEAIAISGMKPKVIEEMVLKTIWVAGFLKAEFAKIGLDVADGKLEWALDSNGECLLIDAIGPDELRVLKDGIQLSKQFLRNFYDNTQWAKQVKSAAKDAETKGLSNWKSTVKEPVPALTSDYQEIGSQIYLSLTNALTKHRWFESAWSIDQLIDKLRENKK